MSERTAWARAVALAAVAWLASGCAGGPVERRCDYGLMDSPAMGKPMAYSVYTPPGWTPDERLPLVVMLHGGGGSHESFDRYGVGTWLDGEIAAGRVPRAVIVNPDGELGFWENWADGSRRYRDWVVDDLLPRVREDYATLDCPTHCHVVGASMGAHGALRFAFFEGEAFSTVTAISGMILAREEVRPTLRRGFIGWFIPFERIWGDIDDPESQPRGLDPYVGWAELERLRAMPLFLAWGDRDKGRIVETNERFARHLDETGLAYRWWRYDGAHKWMDWKRVIAEALRVQVAGKPVHARPSPVSAETRLDGP